MKRFNWPLWLGFVLSIVAFITYFAVFVWFPFTRDFPWASLLIFLIAALLVLIGIRRGFSSDRPHPTRSKIITSLVATLSALVLALFILTIFVAGRQLPASKGAPQVGQRVPDFTLPDTSGKQVSLAELLSSPINGKATKGVLLVFYRGYW
jgi:hypothetical protein